MSRPRFAQRIQQSCAEFALPAAADLTQRWTLSGGHWPAGTDKTVPKDTTPRAAASIAMDATGRNGNQANIVPGAAPPGRRRHHRGHYVQTDGPGTAYEQYRYYDAKGIPIGAGASIPITADRGGFTLKIWQRPGRSAPPGTAIIGVTFGVNGGGRAWFALPMMACQERASAQHQESREADDRDHQHRRELARVSCARCCRRGSRGRR